MKEQFPEGYVQEPHLTEFMTQDMRSKCGSCMWFNQAEDPTWDEGKQETARVIGKIFSETKLPIIRGIEWCGECRRYPPTVTADADGSLADWPQVEWDYWCGEYKRKPIPEGKAALSGLNLSARAANVCRLWGFEHGVAEDSGMIDFLVQQTSVDLLERRNVGFTTLHEIELALGKVGLHFADRDGPVKK